MPSQGLDDFPVVVNDTLLGGIQPVSSLGRERDRAREQGSLHYGHRQPEGEVGRVGGRVLYHLPERGRGQAGPGRPGRDRLRTAEEDRLGEKVRRDLRPAH